MKQSIGRSAHPSDLSKNRYYGRVSSVSSVACDLTSEQTSSAMEPVAT